MKINKKKKTQKTSPKTISNPLNSTEKTREIININNFKNCHMKKEENNT